MGPVSAVSLAAVLVLFGLSALNRRAQPCVWHLAVLYLTEWALCKVLFLAYGAAYHQFLPVIDFGLVLMIGGVLAWHNNTLAVWRAPRWQQLVFALVAAQMLIHIAYPGELSLYKRGPYLFALNTLAFARLGVTVIPLFFRRTSHELPVRTHP